MDVKRAQVEKNGRVFPLEHEINSNGIRDVLSSIADGAITVRLDGKNLNVEVAKFVAEQLANELQNGGGQASPASTSRPGM